MQVIPSHGPISLLSAVSKVMERIVIKFLYNHLKNNFVISENQSGFQPGQSIMKQLIKIYHEFCKSLEKGKEIRVVFLDISKAFYLGVACTCETCWNRRYSSRELSLRQVSHGVLS